MTDYSELVKALRLCQFGECGCGKCYYEELKGDWCTEDNHPEFFDCDDKLKLDAAAAIEALLKENKELIEDRPEMVETDGHWEWRKPNGEVLMPKRGEWIKDEEQSQKHVEAIYTCSACHNFDAWGVTELYPYCPNCGAKMKEVQE